MGAQENKNSAIHQEQEKMEGANSQEESTISEQAPNGEIGVKTSQDMMNSRKRKASSKGKAKETSNSFNPTKVNKEKESTFLKTNSHFVIVFDSA